MTLEPGTVLGRYEILAVLGHGGMATVYKAFQPSLERVVALKVLRPAFASDPEFVERFEREAKAIARLRHPHIVQVHDYDRAAGYSFLAMEFLDGGTLKHKLAALTARGERLSGREAARLASEVADALAYAHTQGIVHRDIKPSNILLTPDGRAVVADFGIAKILAAAQYTQTGVGIGTPEYMSPEQGQGKPVDQRADIYSLGVVAYELLTGSVPFSADTPLGVVYAHAHDPLPLPSTRNTAIGPRTEQALLKALAKDPAARYDDARAFAEELTRAVAEEEHATIPTVVLAARTARGEAPSLRARVAGLSPLQRAIAAVLSLVFLAGGAIVATSVGAQPNALSPVTALESPRATPTPTSAPSPTPTTPISPSPTPTAIASPSPTPAPSPTAVPTPTPTIAPPSPTAAPSPSPTPPPAPAALPKGALVYQAKLDGTQNDVVLPRYVDGDAAATDVRFPKGAVELVLLNDKGNTSVDLRMSGQVSYVGELDLQVLPGANLFFQWGLRWAVPGKLALLVQIDSRSETMELVMYNAVSGSAFVQSLTPRVTVAGLQSGRTFTIAAVVRDQRYILYLDGKQVADVTETRVAAERTICGLGIFPGASGTVRVVGARIYALATP